MTFFAELKRRNVLRAATFYAASAWLIVQVATQVFPFFGIDSWVVRWIVIAAAIGFPFAMLLAWFYEWTPQGIQRESEVHSDESVMRETSKKLDRWIIAVLALAVVLLLTNQFVLRKDAVAESGKNESTVPGKSIAVLPLVNLGSDPKDDYLGDGISEEVLNALSKLHGLKVIGRASSFQFRGRDVDAGKVGRALNVGSLLSGTVQRDGSNLRISVELIDTVTGAQLWSDRYDRAFGSLFALEDDISGAVSKALAVKLGDAAGQPLVAIATTSAHAHDLYLQARTLAEHSDEADLNQAVVLYNQAIAEDSNYAAAWAGLASAYAFLSDAYRAPIDLYPAMKSAAEKAVALDPNLADGHAFLGYALMADKHDFPASKIEAERAVALNPGSADAHMFLGLYRLQGEHNPAAARAESHIAEKLDPRNPWNLYTEMWAATAAGDSDGVLDLARRIHASDPGFFYLSDPMVYAYAVAGRWKDCIDRSVVAQKANGDQPDFAAAICHAHAGDSAQARRILAQLEIAARTRYVDGSDIAAIHAALGENNAAFAALDYAYRDRSQPLLNAWFLPWFTPLRDDPRFQALMDKIFATRKEAVAS